MSFVRVNPGSWGSLSTLTSAQMNTLDTDHANALDKTTAGDTLAGVVGMAATAALDVNSAGAMVQAQVANGINTNIASGIVSGVAAGIALGGGSTDYPTFTNSTGASAVSRSFVRCCPIFATQLVGAWTLTSLPSALYNATILVGGATNDVQVIPIPNAWNGATLSSLSVAFVVRNGHSGVPSTLPTISVGRFGISAFVTTTLSSSDPQSFPTPGSGSAWNNGGTPQLLTYTCNRFNVIDNTQYVYFVAITDEHGSNSIAGNYYGALQLNYTGVTDMRPQ